MEKLKLWLKNIWNNGNARTSLILFITCYFLPVILTSMLTIRSDSDISKTLIYIVSVFPLNVLIFLPVLVILYFVFKKFMQKSVRISAVAVLIPLLVLIYALAGLLIESEKVAGIFMFCAENLAALWLFIILPLGFLFSLFLSKKLIPAKIYILGTMLLMEVVGIIMMVGMFKITPILNENKLKEYSQVIIENETIKAQTGVYPEELSGNFKPKFYKSFAYLPVNNGKDFVIYVKNTKFSTLNTYDHFKYCSSLGSEYCEIVENDFIDGNWVFSGYGGKDKEY